MPAIKEFTFPEAMWAGTEHSLVLAREAHNLLMAGIFGSPLPVEESDQPHNLTIQGDIGIITIRGSLVNNDSPYNRYRDVTSYNDVRKAVIAAATNDSIKAILLDIDSGGGAVSGVADTANLISTVDKSMKPVYSFTDGTMASAAYWLGVSGRAVFASQTSMIGSVGIIATHMEQSQALKEGGIGVTVIRSGKYKALANSMEPLSASGKDQMQAQLDAAYAVFAGHVAKNLGVSVEAFDGTMGQGREFFGATAVDVGLAKSTQTFDSAMALINKKLIDKSAKRDNTGSNYNQGLPMTRQALTEAQITAAAAGIVLDEVITTVAEPVTEVAAVAAVAAKVTEVVKENDHLVTYLQGQVKDLNASLLSQSVDLAGFKAQVESMKASHAGLVKIAAGAVSTMKIGLGQTKIDLSAMSPETLIAEHAATAAIYITAFRVGGVAALTPPADPSAGPAVDPDHLARIAATRVSAKNTK